MYGHVYLSFPSPTLSRFLAFNTIEPYILLYVHVIRPTRLYPTPFGRMRVVQFTSCFEAWLPRTHQNKQDTIYSSVGDPYCTKVTTLQFLAQNHFIIAWKKYIHIYCACTVFTPIKKLRNVANVCIYLVLHLGSLPCGNATLNGGQWKWDFEDSKTSL